MAGNVQTPSGTSFDPSPQFWIDRIDPDSSGGLAVIGRCFFGPVRVGLAFDGVASRQDGGWVLSAVTACTLRVEEIRAFRQLTDEIDQGLSARLVLAGTAPASLTSDSLLVASGYPSHGWSFRHRLWLR
jgi:hypothetical protein